MSCCAYKTGCKLKKGGESKGSGASICTPGGGVEVFQESGSLVSG